MKNKLTAFLIMACFTTASIAAEDPNKQADAWLNNFKKADLNYSGGLSKAELDKTKANEFRTIKKRFDKMDTNKDGQVTPKEYAEHIQKQRNAWVASFKAADLNNSNGLSKVELEKTKPNQFSSLKKNFDAMDANKDGQISIDERDNYKPKAATTTPAPATVDWQTTFKKADLNDSGGLSKVELGQTTATNLDDLKQNFDKIDTNKDGQVTVAEYQAYQNAAAVAAADEEEEEDTGILPFLQNLFK